MLSRFKSLSFFEPNEPMAIVGDCLMLRTFTTTRSAHNPGRFSCWDGDKYRFFYYASPTKGASDAMKQVYAELKSEGPRRNVRLYVCSGANNYYHGEFQCGLWNSCKREGKTLSSIDLHPVSPQPEETDLGGGDLLPPLKRQEQQQSTFRSMSEERHFHLLTSGFPNGRIIHEPNSTSIYDAERGNNRNYTVDFVVTHQPCDGGACATLYVESKANTAGKSDADQVLPVYRDRCGWHAVCMYNDDVTGTPRVYDYTTRKDATWQDFLAQYLQSLDRPSEPPPAPPPPKKKKPPLLRFNEEVAKKRIRSDYIFARCRDLHGKSIEEALRTSYIDAKGVSRSYTRRDLKYDMNKGLTCPVY